MEHAKTGITPDRQARIILEQIAVLLTEAQASTAEIHASLYGPRSTPSRPIATTPRPAPDQLPFGLDRVTDDWETGRVRTPAGCIEILEEVADDWAENLGYTRPTSVPVCEWLADTTEHAYKRLEPEAWLATIGEIRRVYAIATRLAGLHPETTNHTCPNDGTRLERYPLDDGFTDWEICPTCGTPWTRDTYTKAVQTRLRLEMIGTPPDTWVTRAQAANLLGIPRAILDTNVHRGRLQSRAGKINLRQAAQLARNNQK